MRRHYVAFAGLFLLFALATTPARAASISVVNPGFEDPPLGPGGQTGGTPTGWTAFGPPLSDTGLGVYNPAEGGYYTVPVPEGSNLGFVYDTVPSDGFGPFGMAQVLSD